MATEIEPMNLNQKLKPGAITRALRERLLQRPHDWTLGLDGEWLICHDTGFRIRLVRGKRPVAIGTVGSGWGFELSIIERLALRAPVLAAVNCVMSKELLDRRIARGVAVKKMPAFLRVCAE